MPIEGIPETPAPDPNAQPTPDEAVKNTGANDPGKATPAEPKPEAQTTEKTFTQADVDRIVQTRLKSAVKAELKKLSGDDTVPNVEELQRKLSETEKRAQVFEAREQVRDYLSDAGNKLNIRAENMRAIEKLVMAEIEYSDDGKPSNVKDAVNAVKNLAPTLFVNSTASINAGNGRNQPPTSDMNALIRRGAGFGG